MIDNDLTLIYLDTNVYYFSAMNPVLFVEKMKKGELE
jgi:hypothetical protein